MTVRPLVFLSVASACIFQPFLWSDWNEEESDAPMPPIIAKPEAHPPGAEGDEDSVEALEVTSISVQGDAQPLGGLSDSSIFLSPGHGWEVPKGSPSLGWVTQRPVYNGIIEDHSNAEFVLQYLHDYLWQAGARTYTVRERCLNRNMVIVGTGGSGYSQTGTWQSESGSGGYNGFQRRSTTVTGAPTATATFTPNIPEAGFYGVYAWYSRTDFGATTEDARVEIKHTGDTTLWVQNQNQDGFTWKYVGSYYFEAGSNPDIGSVTITNKSAVGGRQVIASAVRFGGGMGSVPDPQTGTISGKPRWEEAARYYAAFMGMGAWDSGNRAADPARYAAWEQEIWERGKSAFVSLHSNGSAGTGTETFIHSSPAAGSANMRQYIHDQLIRDYRAAWLASWADRGKKAAGFAEISSGNNPHMPSMLIEVAFHDRLEDSRFLLDPEFRRDTARAIYKGLVQYFYHHVPGFTNATYLPEPPRKLRVSGAADGTVTLAWDAPVFSTGLTGLYGHAATAYRVYRSKNGFGFDNGIDVTGTDATLEGFQPGEVVYLRVSATNAGGESFPTSTLAVRIPDQMDKRLLLVNGFDRNDRFMNVREGNVQRGYANRLNTRNYIIPHAKAIEAYPEPAGFDSTEAAAVESGAVSLLDYDAVIWMAGLQAHVNDIGARETPAFSSTLRSRLGQYRNAGGQIFISGAEVAWDTNRVGQNNWMNAILKATYIERSASTHSAVGRSASIMGGWTGQFNDGSGSGYPVDFPDVIAPSTGATSAMKYTGTADQVVDGFEVIGGWKQPGWSGSTTADPAGSFSIASNPVYQGSGVGSLAYIWGGAGTFIRVYNQSLPEFSADSDFSIWIRGDNSGHRVRLAVRDSDGELYTNPYTTIDFSGWRQIVWEDVRNNATRWVGSGDGVVSGPNVSFDSIQLSKAPGGPSSGDLYFDYAVASPTETGDDTVKTAAIQYDGAHRVVYVAFPFESITSAMKQADLMARTLDFFGFSLTPFEAWQRVHFTEAELNDPDVSGELADASKDGIANILKYALDLDPRETSRDGLPEMSIEEGFLTFRFNQAKVATDLQFEVEVSDDLVSWTSGDGEVEVVSEVDDGDTWRVTVRDRTPFPDNERRFIRLRITRIN